jgi:predicted secreted protein
MSLVKGENVLLFIYDGGLWKPMSCGKACSITTNAEDIETSILGSGNWRTYEYVALSWTAQLEGLVVLQEVNTMCLPDLRVFQFSRQKVLLRYQRTDDSGNVYTDEGLAIITSITDNGDLEGAATFSMTLKGTGPITMIYDPTPINPNAKVKRFEYTAIGGETYFSDGLLYNKDVIDVVVDGVGRSRLITAGTPVGQEALYEATYSRITLPGALEPDTEVYVLYQDI